MNGKPAQVACSPEGERFAVACDTETGWRLSVYRTEDGALLLSHPSPEHLSCMDWHPAGRWIGVSDLSGAVYLLDSRTGEQRLLGRHKTQAAMTVFSPDGGYLLSGGWERELICWDLGKMQRALTIRLGSFEAKFQAGGRKCATINKTEIRIHAFELPACHREFAEDLGGRVQHSAISPDGKWLAASGLGRLGVWDLTRPGPAALTSQAADARLFFAANGELFASKNDEAFRWMPGPAASPGEAPILTALPITTPDGFTSVCMVSNQVAWTTSAGTQISAGAALPIDQRKWIPSGPGINGASPDSRWLAVYQSFTPLLQVYRLPGLERVHNITNAENIGGFAFSPSGDELAVTSHNRVQFWSTSDWKPLRTVLHCKDILYCPHESAVWLTRDFGEAGLYDYRTLKLMAPLPTGWLPLALSPDGRHVAISVEAQHLQLWDMACLKKELQALGMDWVRESHP